MEPFKELIKKLLKLIGPIETVDNVFIDDENYGGNQEFMDKLSSERLRELWEFAQNFFPDCDCPFSDQDQFFSYLKEHGCGYVAVANIVFQHYNGREAQFEKDFGYPMYDTDGNLNYDQLIVQLYAQYPDAVNSNLPPDYQEEVIEDILGSHGFDVDVDVHYEGLIKEQISYELHNGNQVTVTIPIGTELYTQDANGNYIFDSYLPPHTMEVTGVTKEGYLIVSSWGKKYYIDPNQFNDNPDVNYWYEVVKH